MNLKDFVKQSLLDITEGVTAAQEESLLFIAPAKVHDQPINSHSQVHFEVSVVVSSEVGGGISIWSAANAKTDRRSEHVSKISFDVPVFFQAPTERHHRHFSHRDKIDQTES